MVQFANTIGTVPGIGYILPNLKKGSSKKPV
jgi:hypothetical protein